MANPRFNLADKKAGTVSSHLHPRPPPVHPAHLLSMGREGILWPHAHTENDVVNPETSFSST
eukprot:5600624-Heterocapsa_arctica.AAC.1